LERFGAERSFAIENMKHDTFEQVAEGHIVIFGERLEHFEQAFFHADAGLDALDEKRLSLYHGTNVPMYINNIKPAADSMGGLLSTVRAARRLVEGRRDAGATVVAGL
jgi:hypothetical protein